VVEPIAVESLVPINCSTVTSIVVIVDGSQNFQLHEIRTGSFFFDQVSVLIQRFNAVLPREYFVDDVAGHNVFCRRRAHTFA